MRCVGFLLVLLLLPGPAAADAHEPHGDPKLPPGGCTPCECGEAVCMDGETYWPVLEWTDVPESVVAGQPFTVTYRTGWTVRANDTELPAPGGGPGARSTVEWYDSQRPPWRTWSTVAWTVLEQPQQHTLTLFWPSPGNLTVSVDLDAVGDHRTVFTEAFTVPVLAAGPDRGLPAPPADPGPAPDKNIAFAWWAALGGLSLAMLLSLAASRRRNW